MIDNKLKLIITIVLTMIFICTFIISISPAFADTDGTELRITAQPDRLVLQLGDDWDGAEFELRLDSVLFPVSVIADSSGVLTMELGGSKEYTLTRMVSASAFETSEESMSSETVHADSDFSEASERMPSISPLHFIIFVGGLILAVGWLVIIQILKKRNETYYNNEDYDDDE